MPRGRPKKLTSKMADRIINIQLDRVKRGDPMLKAPAMRRHLLQWYRETLRARGMADDKIESTVENADKELFPGVSTIQKFIAEIKDSPLDKPFSLGALKDHPISPETLPMVLRVWADILAKAEAEVEAEVDVQVQMTFTIRHALWVARLSKLFNDPEDIWGLAFWYSVRERAYEAIGEDMDTSDLDTELLKNFKPTPTESKRKKKGGTT